MAEIEVRLDNVRMFARHGVFEHETRDGNVFEVSLAVKYQEREITDEIESTISYVSLYEIVKREMAEARKLLETVASSIAIAVREAYPYCTTIECKVTKLTPPISGFMGTASVIYRIGETS